MRLDPHGGDGDPQNWKRRYFILNGPELLYYQPLPKPADGEPADGKPKQKQKQTKPADGKPADGKPVEGKPAEGKTSQEKPAEGKSAEGKPAEGKTSQEKPAEGKAAEGKTSQEKPKRGKLLGSLSLPGSTAQALLPEEIGGALFAFEVECGATGKVIELRATSVLDMAEWLEILHQASESPIDLHEFHELESADASVAGEQSTVNHNSHADSLAATPTTGDGASGDREGHTPASPPQNGAGGRGGSHGRGTVSGGVASPATLDDTGVGREDRTPLDTPHDGGGEGGGSDGGDVPTPTTVDDSRRDRNHRTAERTPRSSEDQVLDGRERRRRWSTVVSTAAP